MHSHYTIRCVKTDSNLQTIEDWISSDLELSKSKGDSMSIWFTLVICNKCGLKQLNIGAC